jgi:hypothetical protein
VKIRLRGIHKPRRVYRGRRFERPRVRAAKHQNDCRRRCCKTVSHHMVQRKRLSGSRSHRYHHPGPVAHRASKYIQVSR